MIFRRIKAHIAKEDWFAVFIDFIIVVFGVFIGMQVSNWNDAQSSKRQEQTYLLELRAEITENNKVNSDKNELTYIVVESGERALAFLEDDKPCETMCWQLLVDFFLASQVASAPFSSPVLEEMERLGLPRSPSVKNALDSYSSGMASLSFSIGGSPPYRDLVRSLLPVSAQRVLWRDCHRIGIRAEYYITDCAVGLNDREIIDVLEKLRANPDIHKDLTYWIGQNVFLIGAFNAQSQFNQTALIAIDQELARH